MPSFSEAMGSRGVDIMMPKKRQQGFDIGQSNLPSSGVDVFASSANYHQPTTNNMFHSYGGANGMSNSFIDTDILLNDDLWNDFAPAGHPPPSDSMQVDHREFSRHVNEGSFVNIPHSASNMFGLESRITNDSTGRLSKETSSMDDNDSPDGSNGETISTVATSILSPGSHGTMADNTAKAATRHQRTSSNASVTTGKNKSGRSLSRSRNRAAAGASERRTAERSPSVERGGFGKAPSSRARASRRASIGPAALANAATVNNQSRVSASASELSSSLQMPQTRWGMLGDNVDHNNLRLNLHDQVGSMWNARTQQGRPGNVSASSSLPNQPSFQTSMQHLHLQSPPLHYSFLGKTEEDNSKAFNPFLFPPYTQAPSESAHPEFSQLHDSQMATPFNHPSDAASTADIVDSQSFAKPALSKVRRNSSKKVSKPTIGKADPVEKHILLPNPNTVDQCDEQDDDEDDEDDDDIPLKGVSTPEAEAKRLAEKRRRRRESHNAVERRRRDNINEKITELATLLPESMLLDAIATSTQGGNIGSGGSFAPALAAKAALAAAAAAAAKGDTLASAGNGQDGAKTSTEAYAAALAPAHANSEALAAAQAKPNKGIILRKSVEYIRHLQQFLDMQMGRISFLESEMQRCHQVMASSGIQAPAPSDPHQGMSMMNAFLDAANDNFFGEQSQPQQQHQQQPSHDFSAMNMLSLGMPSDNDLQQQHQQHQQQHHHHHQHRQHMQQQHVHHQHHNQSHHCQAPPMSGSHDGAPPALAAWPDGFDQRTGLPRRSSVDVIEEEELEDGDGDIDTELSRRGRSQSFRLSQETQDEDWRGRSRQKGTRLVAPQEGSWPDLCGGQAQSPMQFSGKETLPSPAFAGIANVKIETPPHP